MKNKLLAKSANIILFVLCIMLVINQEAAANAAEGALKICAFSVIPTLFPFMVMSSLIVSNNLLKPLYRFIPVKQLFGFPQSSAGAFLLGAICGFPIGAKTVCGLYKKNEITLAEAEKICAVSNNTGPAFAAGVAGAYLWGNRRFGIYLYFAQITAVIIIGIILNKATGSKITSSEKTSGTQAENNSAAQEKPSLLSSLSDAVSESAASCIPLCGYITFFSIVCTIVKCMIPNQLICAVVCAVLEFTAGIREAALTGGVLGLFLTGFALGFSGFSVFTQSYSFTAPLGISLKRTLSVKFTQGFLCGGLCTLFPVIFTKEKLSPVTSSGAFNRIFSACTPVTVYIITAFAVFLAGILTYVIKQLKSR